MIQREPSPLEYAILGLLHGGAMSGYDVRKVFATTPMWHYSDSPGAVYPALRRLASQELVSAKVDARTALRPRRMFQITRAGRTVFHAWLKRPLCREDVVQSMGDVLLRFAFTSGHLNNAEIEAFLHAFIGETRGYLKELRAYYEHSRSAMPLTARLAMEHGLQGYETHVRWAQRALQDLQGGGS